MLFGRVSCSQELNTLHTAIVVVILTIMMADSRGALSEPLPIQVASTSILVIFVLSRLSRSLLYCTY